MEKSIASSCVKVKQTGEGKNKPKFELDAEILKELPLFKVNKKVNETGKEKKENAVFDQTMKQLPPNSDNFYIDHDKKTDTFTVKKENVELLGKNPLHPRTRLTRKNKKDDVVFLGKNGLYP